MLWNAAIRRGSITGFDLMTCEGELGEMLYFSGGMLDDVKAEVFHWWLRSGDDEIFSVADEARMFSPSIERRMKQLSDIEAFPAMRSYFSAGIWDVDFISRCMDEGIDASLAANLSNRVPETIA